MAQAQDTHLKTVEQRLLWLSHWLRQYNNIRPDHAFNMRPPMPETLLEKSKISGTEIGG